MRGAQAAPLLFLVVSHQSPVVGLMQYSFVAAVAAAAAVERQSSLQSSVSSQQL